MIYFTENLLLGEDDIKLSITIKNKQGRYVKGKLSNEDLWISLNISEDLQKQQLFEDAIDHAVAAWIKQGQKEDFLRIPKGIIRGILFQG